MSTSDAASLSDELCDQLRGAGRTVRFNRTVIDGAVVLIGLLVAWRVLVGRWIPRQGTGR